MKKDTNDKETKSTLLNVIDGGKEPTMGEILTARTNAARVVGHQEKEITLDAQDRDGVPADIERVVDEVIEQREQTEDVKNNANKPSEIKLNDLTAKQSAFVRCLLKGDPASGKPMSQSDAYRHAYDADNMSDAAIWNEASKLCAHPVVSIRLHAGMKRLEDGALHSGLSLRSHVQRELYQLSTHADTDQAKIRSLELLGKLDNVGAFVERIENTDTELTSAQVRAEIERKLKEKFGG